MVSERHLSLQINLERVIKHFPNHLRFYRLKDYSQVGIIQGGQISQEWTFQPMCSMEKYKKNSRVTPQTLQTELTNRFNATGRRSEIKQQIYISIAEKPNNQITVRLEQRTDVTTVELLGLNVQQHVWRNVNTVFQQKHLTYAVKTWKPVWTMNSSVDLSIQLTIVRRSASKLS